MTYTFVRGAKNDDMNCPALFYASVCFAISKTIRLNYEPQRFTIGYIIPVFVPLCMR